MFLDMVQRIRTRRHPTLRHGPTLIISTIATFFGLLTSLLGCAGILLNNRRFLATYAFPAWLEFAFLVIPGHITGR
ncbi:hypothetical protein BDN72DRAFT_573391 [Pluteus cervinus]|uniref:Uncharacterized protein n=1 Tax=Pluteus cervinus TaxID=181527 RepID=A0ACD3AWD1_9AGAR|nr:hypothetical protein BDN72DRAFT_573391 [Pluteus cervinus]